MKNIIIILCFVSINAFGQNEKVEFDGSKWNPPYSLDIPQGWNVERFLIPIEFAPQIPYKGVEDLRLTPGWAKAESDEYWTYVFLWYLDDSPETNEKIIEENLKAYYTGLVDRNIESRKIPPEKVVPLKTYIEKV